MISALHPIPNDIFRDMILPYTYCPQPAALLADLLSYHQTMSHLKTLYCIRFPTVSTTPSEDSDLAWLSNDICRFLNNDQPTMFGYVEFYRDVFRRLYMNHANDTSASPHLDSFGTVVFSDIKVSIGLLLPAERLRLESYLGERGSNGLTY